MWSSSGAASAGCSPPEPSSGPRCGSPSSTGPTTISSSPCSTRWRPGSSRRARSRRPSATCCGITPALRTILGEVEHIDVEAREVHVDEFGKPLTVGYDSLIVAGGGLELLLRSRRVSGVLVRHEVAGRRPGPAGRHLRLLRARRGREGPREAPAPHDVRRGRRRTDRRGDLGPAARALAAGAPAQLPHDRPGRHPRRPGGGPGPARRVDGDLPVAHDAARSRPHGRRDPPRRNRDGHGRRRCRGHQEGRHARSGSPPPPRSGRPGCGRPDWGRSWPGPPGRRRTRPAGSGSTPTARCRRIPRCSSSAT